MSTVLTQGVGRLDKSYEGSEYSNDGMFFD